MGTEFAAIADSLPGIASLLEGVGAILAVANDAPPRRFREQIRRLKSAVVVVISRLRSKPLKFGKCSRCTSRTVSYRGDLRRAQGSSTRTLLCGVYFYDLALVNLCV
jgi:hypothetical protein